MMQCQCNSHIGGPWWDPEILCTSLVVLTRWAIGAQFGEEPGSRPFSPCLPAFRPVYWLQKEPRTWCYLTFQDQGMCHIKCNPYRSSKNGSLKRLAASPKLEDLDLACLPSTGQVPTFLPASIFGWEEMLYFGGPEQWSCPSIYTECQGGEQEGQLGDEWQTKRGRLPATSCSCSEVQEQDHISACRAQGHTQWPLKGGEKWP